MKNSNNHQWQRSPSSNSIKIPVAQNSPKLSELLRSNNYNKSLPNTPRTINSSLYIPTHNIYSSSNYNWGEERYESNRNTSYSQATLLRTPRYSEKTQTNFSI